MLGQSFRQLAQPLRQATMLFLLIFDFFGISIIFWPFIFFVLWFFDYRLLPQLFIVWHIQRHTWRMTLPPVWLRPCNQLVEVVPCLLSLIHPRKDRREIWHRWLQAKRTFGCLWGPTIVFSRCEFYFLVSNYWNVFNYKLCHRIIQTNTEIQNNIASKTSQRNTPSHTNLKIHKTVLYVNVMFSVFTWIYHSHYHKFFVLACDTPCVHFSALVRNFSTSLGCVSRRSYTMQLKRRSPCTMMLFSSDFSTFATVVARWTPCRHLSRYAPPHSAPDVVSIFIIWSLITCTNRDWPITDLLTSNVH